MKRIVMSVWTDGRAVLRARWYFRRATSLGHFVRLWGRPRVTNAGRLVIGEKARIASSFAPIEIVAAKGGQLTIGERTFINFGTSIVAHLDVRIGSDCHLGPYCMVMDNSYHRVEPERRNEQPPSAAVVLGDNVWLGARVIVLPGVTIGDHSVIGAGSVVSRDIPARSLAGGVPAKVIKQI